MSVCLFGSLPLRHWPANAITLVRCDSTPPIDADNWAPVLTSVIVK